jgi:hypothetical protein
VQTRIFISFQDDKNAPTPNNHHVGHISSPLLTSTLKTPASLSTTLFSAHRPLQPHHLSSHQAQANTRCLQTISRSNPLVSRDGTAAAVNLTAVPATQTSPVHFDHLEIALNAIVKAKW